MQACSLVSDAARVTALQAIMQSSSYAIDAINMLHLIAPGTALFLWFVASCVDLPQMHMGDVFPMPIIGASATLAFALNLASYALIKNSSALLVSMTGIVKDILIITGSWMFWGTPVSATQCVGYLIAVGGMLLYHASRTPMEWCD